MADVQLSKNFYLSELLISNTATRLGIENTPTEKHLKNLKEATTNLWQPTRDLIGHPMSISSGYRNPQVNSAVGGEKISAHPEGFAIDFISPGFGTPKEIALFLVKEYRAKVLSLTKSFLNLDGGYIWDINTPKLWHNVVRY